jgi:hypothetical protein
LNNLSAAECDGCKKHFYWHFSTVTAQHQPFESRAAVD